jgi:hypothetical protein
MLNYQDLKELVVFLAIIVPTGLMLWTFAMFVLAVALGHSSG